MTPKSDWSLGGNMDAQQISFFAIVAVCSGVLSIGTLAYAILFMGYRYGRLELKVETLWNRSNTWVEFQLRRGLVDAVDKGLVTMNSPVTIKPEARELLTAIKPDLIAIAEANPTASVVELAEVIERKLGDTIMHSVCLPLRISSGACLIMALAIVKETTGRQLEL
jgi:hypothetical protein